MNKELKAIQDLALEAMMRQEELFHDKILNENVLLAKDLFTEEAIIKAEKNVKRIDKELELLNKETGIGSIYNTTYALLEYGPSYADEDVLLKTFAKAQELENEERRHEINYQKILIRGAFRNEMLKDIAHIYEFRDDKLKTKWLKKMIKKVRRK